MDEYPDPYEEYDQYGVDADEYEVMMEQDAPSKPPPIKTSANRRSINFDNPDTNQSNSSLTQNKNSSIANHRTKDDDLYFEELSYGDETIELNLQTQPPALTEQILSTSDNNSKKRNYDEIFGDITDLDFEDDFLNRREKKAKKEKSLEYDLDLIRRLSELRELSKANESMTYKGRKRVEDIDRLKDNVSTQVPKWPFIPIGNLRSGSRLYVRCHSEQYMQEELSRVGAKVNFVGIMGNSFRSTWEEAQKIINARLNVEENSKQNDVIEVSPIDNNSHLWVDLYKPRNYMELLSDESSNRLLLQWLKLWDKVVFNREIKKKPKPNKPNLKFGSFQKDTKFQKFGLSDKLDEHNRPEHKVILLCGPPGLGKTTLAHLVARHAGYNVVEINASDDRSVEAFKNALENSTQMKSVIDKENRPNCIVLDEIDGAPANTIDYLIKFISGTASSKAKKANKKKNFILKRPIICICNDLYVPALRALRQIALVINFPPTESARLAERLSEIASLQKVQTDVVALIALSEKTQNDIRSCLSVLHFFKSQNKPVTLVDVYKSNIGQKDMQKGLFEIWQQIFQIQRAKLRMTDVKFEDNGVKKEISTSLRARWVLDSVHSFGEYDKLIQGVFENYPMMRQRDSYMENISEALEWFCFTDNLNTSIYGGQNFILLPYIQYAFVTWHFVFSIGRWQKIVYPNTQFEVNQKIFQTRSTVSEVLRGVQPRTRSFLNSDQLVLDIIPYLNDIIIPDIRPINVSLYTPGEKAIFKNIVNIMIDYNLTYVQEKQPDGSYTFQIEPNIDQIAYFQDMKPERISPYWARQMLAREIELEKARRNEPEIHDTNDKELNNSKKQPNENLQKKDIDFNKKNFLFNKKSQEKSKTYGVKSTNITDCVKPSVPNHLQTLRPKVVDAQNETVISRDFFGRKVVKNVADVARNSNSVVGGDIWYHFKEGYNNAVRKDVPIDYFL